MVRKRRPISSEEIAGQHGAELPEREALSLVIGPAPAHLLPVAQAAAQTVAPAAAEDVAPTAPAE